MADNPFLAGLAPPKATAAAPAPPTANSNPFLGHLRGRFGDASGYPSAANKIVGPVIGPPAATIGSILNSLHYAWVKHHTGKSDPDEARAVLRGELNLPTSAADWRKVPGIIRGPTDVAIDTLNDPGTIVFGLGGLARAGLARGAEALAPRVGAAVAKLPVEHQEILRHVAQIPEQIARPFRPGTKAQAALPGPQRDIVLGSKNLGAAEGTELGRRLQSRLATVTKDLKPEDEIAAYRALNGEVNPLTLSASGQQAFKSLRTLQDEAKYFNATPELRRLIAMRQAGFASTPTGRAARVIKVTPDAPFNFGEVKAQNDATDRVREKYVKTVMDATGVDRNTALGKVRDWWKGTSPSERIPEWERVGYKPGGIPPPPEIPMKGALSRLQTATRPPLRRSTPHTVEPGQDNPILKPRPKLNVTARTPVKPLPLSPDIQRFPLVPGQSDEYRYRHLPFPTDPNVAPRPARSVNLLNFKNPSDAPRNDLLVEPARGPEPYREAFGSMLGNAGRDYGVSRTAAAAKKAFGGHVPLEVEDAFEQSFRGEAGARTNKETYENLYKNTLGYGRAAQVSLSPYHFLANVVGLTIGHDPTLRTLLRVAAKLPKALVASPEQRYEMMTLGREAGTIAPFLEKQAPFQRIPLLGPWAKTMSHVTWTGDDLAKNEMARTYLWQQFGPYMKGVRSRLMDLGLDKKTSQEAAERLGLERAGFQPGRRAAEDLIDYANPSGFGRLLSWVSKFPNYRSQLIPSVVRAVAKNPARLETLNRATGNVLLGGDAPDPRDPNKTIRSYGALADVGRGLASGTGAIGFVRSTLADPVKTVAALIQEATPLQTKRADYFTYGLKPWSKQWVLGMLLAGLPESQEALSATGNGRFQVGSALEEALFQATGVAVRSKPSAQDKARQTVIKQLYGNAISLARKGGDNALADKMTAQRDALLAQKPGSSTTPPPSPLAPLPVAPTAASSNPFLQGLH